MKAFVIDAEKREVREAVYNGDFHEIYKLGGFNLFTAVEIEDGDAIFVDDDGLLHDPQHFFVYRGFDQPLAGNGVVLGTDHDGESTDAKVTLDALKERVVFVTLDEAKDIAARIHAVTPLPPGAVPLEPDPNKIGRPFFISGRAFSDPDENDESVGRERGYAKPTYRY